MPIQKLDQWAKPKVLQTIPLSALKDAYIGIDASYYLDLRLNAGAEEPLKHALGGVPFCLKRIVEDDLQMLKEAGIEPIFVFNGLDYVNKTPSESQSAESARARENAWTKYQSGDAEGVVQEFSRAKYPVEMMNRYLQKILVDNKIQFMVAPYSAIAQLAYLVKLPEQFIDVVMGSTEYFLFNVEKVITNFDFANKNVEWISKASCEDRLKVSSDVLRDAQLLLGTSFSLPFPLLERSPTNKQTTITDAINLLNQANRSVITLCNIYRDDPVISQLQYADRYRKSIMTIRHHVVLESNGAVAPLDFERAPGDVHDFVGQNLPEELFFYMSKGLLGTQVPNWLASGEITLSLQGGILDSEPYRRLLIEQLNPLRTEALKVLAESLHYYYQSRIVKVKSWDGRDTSNLTIALRDVPPLKPKTSQWKVRDNLFTAAMGKGEVSPSFLTCLQALKDDSFVTKTITKARVDYPALKTKDEIIANTLWRFLYIRGYIDDKHELTKWGQVLEAALVKLEGVPNADNYGILVVELLRLGLLNGNAVDGTSVSSADKDYQHKTNVNLVSKIACVGRLRHKSTGFVGPLDRQLLSFASMLTALRCSLRDLLEAIMAGMFLSGDAERDRDDWGALAQSLPLINDNGASLGVAVKTYLDTLKDEGTIDDDIKQQIKSQKGKYNWFVQTKGGVLNKSLDTAWMIWDAVVAGVEMAGKDVKDQKPFSDTNTWLESRR